MSRRRLQLLRRLWRATELASGAVTASLGRLPTRGSDAGLCSELLLGVLPHRHHGVAAPAKALRDCCEIADLHPREIGAPVA